MSVYAIGEMMNNRLAPTIVLMIGLVTVVALGSLAIGDQTAPARRASVFAATGSSGNASQVLDRVDHYPRVQRNDVEAALRAANGYADPILDDIEKAGGPALTRRIDTYRQAIIDVSPALKSLKARQEDSRHSALAASALAVWHEMLLVYYEAAPSPTHRRQLEARYPAVTEAACQARDRDPSTNSRVAAARY
jgi:hypothetical protein